MTETVRVPYEKFKEFVVESRENGTQKRMLSLEEESRVKVTFQSGRNLKAVAETKALRKKLGKFMADHFLRWKGSRQITVYDDFEPYSFFFQETFCCLQETHLREKDRHYLRVKAGKQFSKQMV